MLPMSDEPESGAGRPPAVYRLWSCATVAFFSWCLSHHSPALVSGTAAFHGRPFHFSKQIAACPGLRGAKYLHVRQVGFIALIRLWRDKLADHRNQHDNCHQQNPF